METPTPSPSKKLPLKQKVEAILFAVGQRISLADITRLARSREDAVKEVLGILKQEYEGKDTSLVLIEDGNFYKLAVRDHYLPVVKKIVTETELSKTVLETLAVIAFKYPIRQSDLIKIRTNKAYDHLKELEGQGFISRKRHGRTNLIKLTEKFFNYFDLPEEKLKEHLADFESIAQAISKKEVELTERKQQQAQELAKMQSQEDRIKQEIEGLDDNKTTQEPAQSTEKKTGESKEPQDPSSLITPEKVGRLEVYEDRKSDEEQDEDKVKIYDLKAEKKQDEEETSESSAKSPEPKENSEDTQPEGAPAESKGIEATKEMESEIDKKVAEMLTPKKEPMEEEQKGYDPKDGRGDDELEETLDAIRKKKKRNKDQ
jgi:segregation and condensation protein B